MDTVKPSPAEQIEVAKRLSQGICPNRSLKLVTGTAELARTWTDSAFAPMPDKLAELCAALESKLAGKLV